MKELGAMLGVCLGVNSMCLYTFSPSENPHCAPTVLTTGSVFAVIMERVKAISDICVSTCV